MPKAETVHVLCRQMDLTALPAWVLEYRFAPVVDEKHVRLWRADVAWPGLLIAVEIDGGHYTGGRHGGIGNRGGAKGVHLEMEKTAAYVALGWRVLHVTPYLVERGIAIEWIKAAHGLKPFPY